MPTTIRSLCLVLTVALSTSGAAQLVVPRDALLSRIWGAVGEVERELVAFRRDLHMHPEVSGNEQRTAGQVAKHLRKLGLEVRENIGGFGVLATLRGGRPGPTVAYRADMDAVTSIAADPMVEIASRFPGVRHVCGHDVHTAIAIGLAEVLARVRDELPGSIQFVFQPAEESGQGARAMLGAGMWDQSRPVAIYGVHTAPYETGDLATMVGQMMSARDRAVLTVRGDGARARMADSIRQRLVGTATITPAQIGAPSASDFVSAFVPSRHEDGDSLVVTANFSLASPDVRRRLRHIVEREIPSWSGNGLVIFGRYEENLLPGVTNDSVLEARARAALAALFGASHVRTPRGISPGFTEDFGWFQQRVPGVFFFLGVSNARRGWQGLPHSPGYVADEASIAIGVRAMSVVLLERLRRG